MAFSSQKMTILSAIAFSCVFAAVILNSSAAPTSSKKVVEKDETVNRHKNTETEKKLQNSHSSSDTTGVSAKQEIETKSRSVKGQPKTVLLKPVPGQLEKLFPAATHLEGQVDIGGQGDLSKDSAFLQEDSEEPEEEEDEEGEEEEELELPENEIYKRWQDVLADPRLQNLLEEREIQRRTEAEEEAKMTEQEPLYPPELVEYLARVGAVDKTIDDLVINGEMSPREAALYREAIDMEYAPPPPSSPLDIDMQQAVEDPEELFDIANSDDRPTYGEPNDYIFPPVPPQGDYSSDYVESSAPELLVPSEEEERTDEEEEEEEDYLRYKELEEAELLRQFLRIMALRQNEQEPSLESVAVENGNHGIGSVPAAAVPVPSKSDNTDIAVEKELEALPLLAKINNKTPDARGREEELQLEEIRNRKTKQDNRTKSVSKVTKSVSKGH